MIHLKPYERIKYYREKILGISQAKFAKKLKISTSNLSNIEVERVRLTDRVISEIAEAYNLNENWIKTGEEPIEKPQSRDEEILTFFNKIKDNDNIFAKRFILALSKLDMQDWEALDKLINNYLDISKDNTNNEIIQQRTKPDHKLTPAEKRHIVNTEIESEEKATTFIASTGTNGI